MLLLRPTSLLSQRLSLHTSSSILALRDMFVWEKDLKKRPSALEIKKKGLPQNTPTLKERIRRDR